MTERKRERERERERELNSNVYAWTNGNETRVQKYMLMFKVEWNDKRDIAMQNGTLLTGCIRAAAAS